MSRIDLRPAIPLFFQSKQTQAILYAIANFGVGHRTLIGTLGTRLRKSVLLQAGDPPTPTDSPPAVPSGSSRGPRVTHCLHPGVTICQATMRGHWKMRGQEVVLRPFGEKEEGIGDTRTP